MLNSGVYLISFGSFLIGKCYISQSLIFQPYSQPAHFVQSGLDATILGPGVRRLHLTILIVQTTLGVSIRMEAVQDTLGSNVISLETQVSAKNDIAYCIVVVAQQSC